MIRQQLEAKNVAKFLRAKDLMLSCRRNQKHFIISLFVHRSNLLKVTCQLTSFLFWLFDERGRDCFHVLCTLDRDLSNFNMGEKIVILTKRVSLIFVNNRVVIDSQPYRHHEVVCSSKQWKIGPKKGKCFKYKGHSLSWDESEAFCHNDISYTLASLMWFPLAS